MDALTTLSPKITDEAADCPGKVNRIVPVLFTCIGAFGVLANSLVFGATFVQNRLQSSTNVFMFNLTIADFVASAIALAIGILGLAVDPKVFIDQKIFCEIIGTACFTGCSCSLWSLAAISFNRYVSICHRSIYDKVFNKRTIPMIIPALWLTCFLACSLNIFFGWGSHEYEPKFLLCTFDYYGHNYSYTIFLSIVGIVSPLTLVTVSYAKIAYYYKQQGKNLKVTTKQGNKKAYKRLKEKDKQLLVSVFLIVVVFLVMWIPYIAILLVDYHGTWPSWLHVIGIILIHVHTCANSLLYVATNPHFRKRVLKVLELMCCKPVSAVKISSKSQTENSYTKPSGGFSNTTISKVQTSNSVL